MSVCEIIPVAFSKFFKVLLMHVLCVVHRFIAECACMRVAMQSDMGVCFHTVHLNLNLS